MEQNRSVHHCTLTNSELIVKAECWIDDLIKSGGKAFTMQVPARPNADTDLILSETVERFKALLKYYNELRAKCDKMEQAIKSVYSKGAANKETIRLVNEALEQEGGKEPTTPQQGDRCPECGAPCKIIEKTYQEEIHDVHYVEHQYAPQQGAVTTVFVPCREDDPRSCGAYQSHCGRSLAYVRESQVPVVESGAGWVKASERLPGWGQYVRWRHESGKELPGKESVHSMTDTSPVSLHGFEWLDEGGEKEVTNG